MHIDTASAELCTTSPSTQDAARSTILIIDDSPLILATLGSVLRPQYRVLAATSGLQGLRVAQDEPRPDLILLDVLMPELDGYGVLERLRADPATEAIPVIFLTGAREPEQEERGLRLGAADYVAKPLNATVVLARVRTQLLAKLARDWMADRNASLEAEVSRRMAENDLTQQVSIRALAHLAETRDPETGNHILRTQAYVRCLANRLRQHPRFSATLTDRYVELLARSAPLHDIGKVGIPDTVLLKPGKLSAEEWAVMRTHAKLGSDAIEQAERDIETPLEFLAAAKEIAHWHHEKWDGSGYPDGLVGDAIPISARLMALADVFDALISKRVYKQAMTLEETRSIIAQGSGRHFDPDVTAAFLLGFEEFVDIANRYSDASG
jgi:putative two-component system response regulator